MLLHVRILRHISCIQNYLICKDVRSSNIFWFTPWVVQLCKSVDLGNFYHRNTLTNSFNLWRIAGSLTAYCLLHSKPRQQGDSRSTYPDCSWTQNIINMHVDMTATKGFTLVNVHVIHLGTG